MSIDDATGANVGSAITSEGGGAGIAIYIVIPVVVVLILAVGAYYLHKKGGFRRLYGKGKASVKVEPTTKEGEFASVAGGVPPPDIPVRAPSRIAPPDPEDEEGENEKEGGEEAGDGMALESYRNTAVSNTGEEASPPPPPAQAAQEEAAATPAYSQEV
jgi:hypothetical protein